MQKSAEMNIKDLCFTPGGFLVQEFEQIFSDIFHRKSILLLRIDVIKKLLYLNSMKNLIHVLLFCGITYNAVSMEKVTNPAVLAVFTSKDLMSVICQFLDIDEIETWSKTCKNAQNTLKKLPENLMMNKIYPNHRDRLSHNIKSLVSKNRPLNLFTFRYQNELLERKVQVFFNQKEVQEKVRKLNLNQFYRILQSMSYGYYYSLWSLSRDYAFELYSLENKYDANYPIFDIDEIIDSSPYKSIIEACKAAKMDASMLIKSSGQSAIIHILGSSVGSLAIGGLSMLIDQNYILDGTILGGMVGLSLAGSLLDFKNIYNQSASSIFELYASEYAAETITKTPVMKELSNALIDDDNFKVVFKMIEHITSEVFLQNSASIIKAMFEASYDEVTKDSDITRNFQKFQNKQDVVRHIRQFFSRKNNCAPNIPKEAAMVFLNQINIYNNIISK